MTLSTQRNNSKNDRPSKPIRFAINDFVALQVHNLIVKLILNNRLRDRVFYEQIVNESQPS